MDPSNRSVDTSSVARKIAMVIGTAVVCIVVYLVWHTLLTSVMHQRERAELTLSANNLKVIVLALQQNDDRIKSGLIANDVKDISKALNDPEFRKKMGYISPPAICTPDGKPLLSWRVAILTYIDEELYKQFKLDEAWDGPHNKELVAKIPDIYCSPGRPKDGKTLYLECVGEETPFPAHSLPSVGRSNFAFGGYSIRVFEADEEQAVPWTQPSDIILKPGEAIHGIGHARGIGFPVAMYDGSVHFIRGNAPPHDLRQMFTREGGTLDNQYMEYPP